MGAGPLWRWAGWRPKRSSVAIVALLLLAAGGAAIPEVVRSGPGLFERYRLCNGSHFGNCVVDGDTIRHGGETIRLADIDTPEVTEPKCRAEAELGRLATNRLLALLNEGPVEMRPIRGRERDQYGRLLRVVERDGRSLGDRLIAEGLARRWDGARRPWCR